MNCEHCQPLLLDHLYGLLDAAEGAAVEAHLAVCPACAAAQADTARVQGLFARAAKSAFPRTTFEPPAPAPAPQKAGAGTPLPFPAAPSYKGGIGRRVAAALPWAVAAAVLLAIPGTVVPVLGVFDRERAARHDAGVAEWQFLTLRQSTAVARRDHDTRLRETTQALAASKQAQAALLDKWMDEQKTAVQEALTGRQLAIDVYKPATVQPGAPNEFVVDLRDGRANWESQSGRLVAEVRARDAATDAVVYTQDLDHEKRGPRHHVRLPAGVWANVKPGAELSLVVAQVDGKTGTRTPLQEVRLAGPVYTTLLTTDKPAYRPGERLFFRSLTLDRITLRPPPREQDLKYELVSAATGRPVPGLSATGTTDLVRVSGDAGRVEPVRGPDGQPVRGVGCGEFVLPADLADGDYALVLRELPHPGSGNTLPLPVTRTVAVSAGTADHFAKQIGFALKSYTYGSGDLVEAWGELKLQDKPVPGAEITGVAVEADGVPLRGVSASPKTDAAGRANVRFALPADVLDGDVRLRLTFRAAGREESVAERVPVVGRRLVVELFPEGGDALVAGVPCKVYVRATTPAGQPVEIKGVVTDGRETLATVKTFNDPAQPGANRGLAAFTFTPPAGRRVWLKLDSPHTAYAPIVTGPPVHSSLIALVGAPGAVAARTGFVLPDAQLDGVVMSVPDAVTAPGQPVRVHLHSVGRPRTLVVGAYVRGRIADTQKVRAEPGQPAEVRLMAGADPRGGVVRVTAFEEPDGREGETDLKPVAERLVFRRAGELLNLALAVSPAPAGAYAPGTDVSCHVSATDEKGAPAAAVLWAAAVNTGVAPGAKDRTLPTHFLLAGDVKNPDELEYADFLLSDHPKAGEALDLVLGTQGWRRFAEQARVPAGPPRNYPNPNSERSRLIVLNGQNAVRAEPSAAREMLKIIDVHRPLYDAAVRAVERDQAALAAARADTTAAARAQELATHADAAERAARDQAARATAAQAPVRRFHAAVWYGVAGFGALALLCGAVSLVRPRTRLPLGFSTLGAFGLAAFLVVAAGWGDGAQAGAATPTTRDESRTTTAAAPEVTPGATAPKADAPPPPAMPQVFAPPAGVEFKKDGKGRPAVKGSNPPPGAVVGSPRPVGPGGKEPPLPTPLPAPATMPSAPTPPLVRAPEPKGNAFGGGGVGAGGAAYPDMPPKPPGSTGSGFGGFGGVSGFGGPGGPGGGGFGGGRSGGWEPERLMGMKPADATKQYALPGYSFDRAATAADSEALKRANEKVVQAYTDQARRLNAPLQAQFGAIIPPAKSGPGAAGPVAVANTATLAAQVEASALRQMSESVTPRAPLVAREYAAPRPAAGPLSDAVPDTVLWQPVIVLPADGKAQLTFHLGAARGYRLIVAGHTADGRLGEARALLPVAPTAPVVPPVLEALPAPAAPPGP